MSRKKFSKRDLDEQFEAFLKDSVSSEDSFDSARINKFFEAPKREAKPWWDDDEENGTIGSGTGKSFLKSKKSAEDEKPKNNNSKQKLQAAPKPKARKDAKIRVKAESSISKDSLDDISEKSEEDHHDHRPRVHVPNESIDSVDTSELLNMSPQKVGMDTLDELADKEKFFRDLENRADGTLDYRRLNQELSVTANTMSPEGAAKTAATLAALQDIDDEEEDTEQHRHAAPLPSEHLLSEREASEQKPSMLSKVSLLDSLESTMNTTTSPQVGKGTLRDAGIMEQEEPDVDNARYGQSISMKTGGTGMMGTNTSQEIEALHRALKEVGLSATIGNDSQIDISSQGDKGTTADLVQKLLNSSMTKTGKQRNFAEIMAELEQIQRRQDEEASRMADIPIPAERRSPKSPKSLERQRQIEDYEEVRGFDLSPVHPLHTEQDYSQGAHSQRGEYSQSLRGEHSQSHRGGFETSHTEDTEMYLPVTQVSVKERSRSKKKKDQKTDRNKNDKKLEQTRSEQTAKAKVPRDSKVRRSRSDSPRKSEKSGKPKYDRVKSSGYGNLSPHRPPRDTSRDKDFIGMNITKATKSLKDNKRSPAPSPSKGDLEHRSPPSKVPKSTIEVWSPAEITKQKIKGAQSPQQARKGVSGTMKASQLQASIESFTQYIKDHFGSKVKDLPEVKYSVDEPTVSTSFKEKTEEKIVTNEGEKDEIIAKLKGDLEALEKSYERRLEAQKLEYEEQIYQLRQENFVLDSKLSGEGENEAKKKLLAGEPLEGVSKEQIAQLEREMKEQETLIAGYQQENKRLYNELKNVQKQHKQTEERMFKENQKLLAEASNLRLKRKNNGIETQLEQKEEAYRNKGIITGQAAQQQVAAGNTAGAIATLENELQEAKRTTDALNREMLIVQQSRVELEKHVEKLVREREELNRKIEESKTMKSEEARALEEKYQEEIEKLKRKLKWYAENQEILDKSARQLRNKDDDIHKYKMRIEELQTESGKRVEDSKVRARERAADAKKIQDLQRQVKEMEQILKRRNPNALPTLMMAAAAAPDNNQQGNRSAYAEVLEKRVKKLEMELEQKDGETDTLLRGVEQKYNSVKLQYEERIKDLELQLSIYQGQMDHVHPHTHAVALERELESVRERYKQQIKDLQAEVDRMTNEASKSKKVHEATFRVETQSAKETETELRALVKSLQLEVENKTHDLQVMQKSLERLRKEKQVSMTTRYGDGKKTKQKGKSKQEVEDPEFHSLPVQPSANEKEYEPKDFESTHITDVVQENEELKMKVDHLQLQLDQQRVDLQKSLAETEGMMRRNREDYEEKLESLRVNHQKEVQRILAQQALEHSSSRLAELQSKLDTQEVVIKHLREQQARLEVEAEAASVLRIKQTRLEETLKSLNNDLKEAKKSHSPEMRHFEALQEKITQIENKHSQREQELQQIIRNTRQNTNIEIEREVGKWKKLVETKNNEIQKFRMELDSILEVLRVLQKQGVVIPVGSVGVS